MSLFKRRPNRLERLLAAERLGEALERMAPAIPAGSLIYTSDSPKVEVAHVKSALNPGAVCEALSEREQWLGTGSDREREHAAALRPCRRCLLGERSAAS